MANAKLSEAAKTFIVQSVACFDTPSVVVEAVRKEFGAQVTRQTVEGYDPTKKAGAALSAKWRALFEETRKTFLEDTATIAISHRAVRLRALQRMADKAETMGNMSLAAQLHKQAAEEVGNAYTNRRELTGKDGKDLPAPTAPVTIFQLPDNGRG
ncbi:DUF2280 domain-containing protein [Mesorhizobium sp. WSM4310]|uniref:DUF2280 domain-containing protein n=1 Tax=Mesorhizobium sp. WSM4310 TaxID=2589883 RepID=UPI00115E0635|nr:DUF2280 domain-containing protein [Mesorhizobium sp. WSM4310]TRC78527.1 DUF2280 domain-containing protein [Mesorhizobium sp. WSM4310]